MTGMKKLVKTWWLKTHDNIDVYTDGKGNYSLEVLPSLGVECLWVHGVGWAEDQIYE